MTAINSPINANNLQKYNKYATFVFQPMLWKPMVYGSLNALGWESVCWGVGFFCFSWFLGFLVSWFLGFLVSWFLVSWFLLFLVSWFRSFLVPWFQRFKGLPNCHFMFSGRYWSHIQDYQDFIRRVDGSSRHLSFHIFKMSDFHKKLIFLKTLF